MIMLLRVTETRHTRGGGAETIDLALAITTATPSGAGIIWWLMETPEMEMWLNMAQAID
jgi:hypothetical protein